jgi:hypothetical protein
MNKNKNAIAAIILLIVILVAANRKQEEQKPKPIIRQPTVMETRPQTDWRDRPQADREYWSAFHEGMDIEFRKDRGSKEWWSAWEKNFDRQMDAKMRR